jgi:hypothetical protein
LTIFDLLDMARDLIATTRANAQRFTKSLKALESVPPVPGFVP